MKRLIIYAIIYIILLVLKLTGLFLLPWGVFVWSPIAIIIIALLAITYGFLNERYQARKTREFWRRYNSETDEFKMYDDEHEND